MVKFLNLVFSTRGYVGRAAWWWMQLVTLLLGAVLILGLLVTSERIKHLSSVQGVKHDTYLQSLPALERNNQKREMLSEDKNIFYGLGTALLFVFWAHICIEVKRWHDLGLSGWWVWIRIVPALTNAALGPVGGAVVTIVIPIAMIYFLGFKPGIYDDTPEPEDPKSALAVLNDIGGALLLILIVVAVIKSGTFKISPSSDESGDGSLTEPASDN